MKLAEIFADGGVDDGLVIDDSLVKTQSYLVSGLFGPLLRKSIVRSVVPYAMFGSKTSV